MTSSAWAIEPLDQPTPDRTAVSDVEHRLWIGRVEHTMWTLHSRCRPGHTYEVHRWMAERVVDALFPKGVI